jgi:hypothetical protein
MSHEPLRLPAIVTTIVIVLLTLAVVVVTDLDPNAAVALVIGVVLYGGHTIKTAEQTRAFTDSPATIEQANDEAWAKYDSVADTETDVTINE